ncbi:MAG: hypothetical protein HQK65_21590 [Desulfamplus sp.]|nr:hypothetical protein [Desulfamplus sp.]
MKPIFFPFTSLTEYDAKSILSFFETFSYLSTKSDDELTISEPEWFQTLWKQKKYVDPVTLTQEELNPILASIKSWTSWAEANYGKQTRSGYLQSIFRENPYFTSDTDIASIKSQIKKGISSTFRTDGSEDGISMSKSLDSSKSSKSSKALKSSKPLDSPGDINQYLVHDKSQEVFNHALLFLRFAMMTDLENESIDQQLSSIDLLETNLFSELKGDMENSLPSAISTKEPSFDKEFLSDDEQFMESEAIYEVPTEKASMNSKEDRGTLMTEQRLRDWLTLFISKQSYFNDSVPNLFVTTSRAVIDFLLDVIEKSKLMLDIDNFKVHKEKKSSHAGAWSETFQIQWNKDFHIAAKEVLKKGSSSTNNSNLFMNIADSNLFQVAGQNLTVMLVGIKK